MSRRSQLRGRLIEHRGCADFRKRCAEGFDVATAAGLAAAIGITAAAIDNDSIWMALLVGLVAWLTFSATTLLQHNAFELKPPKLTLINSTYQLVLFLAMSLVIGLL